MPRSCWGTNPSPAALPALVHGLHDPEPLVRGAAAWALGRCVEVDARTALEQRLSGEPDPQVREEIHQALDFSA